MIPQQPETSCDIVIPVYGQVEYTRACVESIFAHTPGPFNLIIVDDASKGPESVAYLKDLEAREPQRVRVLYAAVNQGYLKSANLGLAQTSAPFVVVMNNDTLVYPGWLEEMIAVAGRDPSIGIVNPQWDPPKAFAGGRERFFKECVLPRRGTYIETDWARGFCYLTKRGVIERIGGLDPAYDPGYYDDWDYSMRAMAAGYRCVRAMGAFVFHFMNVTYSVSGPKGQVNALINARAPIFYGRWGKPLKVLVIDNGALDDINAGVLGLLRGQNRVVLLTTRATDLAHTNLSVTRVPRWWLGFAAFYVLLDDVRHKKSKRFHLVLGPATWVARVKALFTGYAAALWSRLKDPVFNDDMRELKYGDTGGDHADRV